MTGIEVILGAAVTLAVQLLKKLSAKIGANYTFALVAVLTFLAAWAYNSFKGLISVEVLESWGKIASSQALIWAVFVKFVAPKLKFNEAPDLPDLPQEPK